MKDTIHIFADIANIIEKNFSGWLSVNDNRPETEGDHLVKLDSGHVTVRKFIKGVWMGGMRPFSSSSDVTHFREKLYKARGE